LTVFAQERFYDSVVDMPPHVDGLMDDFTYSLSLLYQRARLWLGYRHTIYLHLQSTVSRWL